MKCVANERDSCVSFKEETQQYILQCLKLEHYNLGLDYNIPSSLFRCM